MKEIFSEMLDDLKNIEASKKFNAPKFKPPTIPGVIPLKELPDELKAVYTLAKFYLSGINLENSKRPENRNQLILDNLGSKKDIAVVVFNRRFRQKYGNDETISAYSNWHVYKVPMFFK
jgi:hypothetical protein